MNLHRNIVFAAQVFREWRHLRPGGEVILGLAPLFHVTGLVCHLGVGMLARVPVVLFHRFDAGVALELIERHRATFTAGAITAFIALLDHPRRAEHDISSLTNIISGGAAIPPRIVERFERETGVYIANGYGMTEATGPSHQLPRSARAPVDPTSGALSVGVPVFGTNSAIVDDDGAPLPPGEIGEIVIAGPQVVPGYWNRPDESAAAFHDGRFRTGDVGIMDDDGFFYIVDRKKDLINAAGYKVWPREVEDVLHGHEQVLEAAVVGIPDDYRGETVKAFVALRPPATATPEELIAFCRARMAAYKYPRSIEIVAELPKTLSGKVLRRELRGRTKRGAGTDA
jgi:long-chain acyl-CoA synthetase